VAWDCGGSAPLLCAIDHMEGNTVSRFLRNSNEDEIAIASCLEKMAKYAGGGPDFYSLSANFSSGELLPDNFTMGSVRLHNGTSERGKIAPKGRLSTFVAH
jgi:hypothetical protein